MTQLGLAKNVSPMTLGTFSCSWSSCQVRDPLHKRQRRWPSFCHIFSAPPNNQDSANEKQECQAWGTDPGHSVREIAPSILEPHHFPKGSLQSGQPLYLFLLGLAPGVSPSTQYQRHTYHEVTSHRHWPKSQSIIGDFTSNVHGLPLTSFSWPLHFPIRDHSPYPWCVASHMNKASAWVMSFPTLSHWANSIWWCSCPSLSHGHDLSGCSLLTSFIMLAASYCVCWVACLCVPKQNNVNIRPQKHAPWRGWTTSTPLQRLSGFQFLAPSTVARRQSVLVDVFCK